MQAWKHGMRDERKNCDKGRRWLIDRYQGRLITYVSETQGLELKKRLSIQAVVMNDLIMPLV